MIGLPDRKWGEVGLRGGAARPGVELVPSTS